MVASGSNRVAAERAVVEHLVVGREVEGREDLGARRQLVGCAGVDGDAEKALLVGADEEVDDGARL